MSDDRVVPASTDEFGLLVEQGYRKYLQRDGDGGDQQAESGNADTTEVTGVQEASFTEVNLVTSLIDPRPYPKFIGAAGPVANTAGVAVPDLSSRSYSDTRGAADPADMHPSLQDGPPAKFNPSAFRVLRGVCRGARPRASRGRPIKRRGSHRSAAPTRAGPDENGDSDPPGVATPPTGREQRGRRL